MIPGKYSHLLSPGSIGKLRLRNRIVVMAMGVSYAEDDGSVGERALAYHEEQARGGAALIISGACGVAWPVAAVQRNQLAISDDRFIPGLRRLVDVVHAHGAKFAVQLHQGGLVAGYSLYQGHALWCPSRPEFDPTDEPITDAYVERELQAAAPNVRYTFRELTHDDIRLVIEQYAAAADRARRAGADGVEIHAGHGYLLSSFLSPRYNRRTDEYGGPLENRARLLVDIVRGVRKSVAPGFAVAVKLNSADFQRGGFSPEDAQAVVAMLAPLGVDLVELSGGSYEAPAMMGAARDERTLAREAYFLDFARDIARVATMPLMVTGGIRRREVAEQVMASGVAMAGIATALAIEPNLPRNWRLGRGDAQTLKPIAWKNKPLASTAHMAAVKYQLTRLSRNRTTAPQVSPVWALILSQFDGRRRAKRYRRWMEARMIAA